MVFCHGNGKVAKHLTYSERYRAWNRATFSVSELAFSSVSFMQPLPLSCRSFPTNFYIFYLLSFLVYARACVCVCVHFYPLTSQRLFRGFLSIPWLSWLILQWILQCWGLKPELCACQASTLPLDLLLQSSTLLIMSFDAWKFPFWCTLFFHFVFVLFIVLSKKALLNHCSAIMKIFFSIFF